MLEALIAIIFIAGMAALGRMSGGGLGVHRWPTSLNRLPELLFAIPFGVAAYHTSDSIWLGIAGFIFSFVAMETGHGNAYHMATTYTQFADRHQTLDYIVRPMCKLFERITGKEIPPRSITYCWVFMATKGLLIGLAAFPFGILLAVLWPLSYHLSFVTLKKSSEPAEWMSAGSAGLLITLTLWSV